MKVVLKSENGTTISVSQKGQILTESNEITGAVRQMRFLTESDEPLIHQAIADRQFQIITLKDEIELLKLARKTIT